jgi:hypothetical protein
VPLSLVEGLRALYEQSLPALMYEFKVNEAATSKPLLHFHFSFPRTVKAALRDKHLHDTSRGQETFQTRRLCILWARVKKRGHCR